MSFTATIEIVPFEVDRNSQVESRSVLSPFYGESHSYSYSYHFAIFSLCSHSEKHTKQDPWPWRI
jgi:hypothetical protein